MWYYLLLDNWYYLYLVIGLLSLFLGTYYSHDLKRKHLIVLAIPCILLWPVISLFVFFDYVWNSDWWDKDIHKQEEYGYLYCPVSNYRLSDKKFKIDKLGRISLGGVKLFPGEKITWAKRKK